MNKGIRAQSAETQKRESRKLFDKIEKESNIVFVNCKQSKSLNKKHEYKYEIPTCQKICLNTFEQ